MDEASPKRSGRRPKAPDVEFNSASTQGVATDGAIASSSASAGLDEDVDFGFDSPESEPVSISALEAVFQPGQAPPRWGGSDPALAELGAPSDVEPAPHSSETSAASLRRMGELVGGALSSENPTSARSVLAPVVVMGRVSQTPPLSSQPPGDRERVVDKGEKSKAEAAPAPKQKHSYFDVGTVPGSALFDAEPAPFDPHVPALPKGSGGADDENDPDSGLLDIRRLAGASRKDDKKKKKGSGRASDDIFNLSGGLFAGGTSAPMVAPDLNALIAPVVSGTSRPGVSTVRSPGAALSPAKSTPSTAPPAPARPSVAPAASPQGPGLLGARVKMGAAIAGFGVVLVLVFLKMSQSPTSPTPTTADSAAPIAALDTAKPAVPTATTPPAAIPEAPTAALDPGAAGKRDKEPAAAAPTAAAAAAANATPTPRATAAPSPAGAGAAPVAAKPTATAAPTVVVVPPPPPAAAEFNKSAAVAALAAAAGRAAGCKQPDGPTGGATVSITFAPSGRVTSSKVTGPPFQGTPVGGCIASAFRSASVPPFDGSPITVTKTVSVR